MATKYQPPVQSRVGQIIDVIFLLGLLFLALFLPLWLKIAVPSRVESLPEGVTYTADADGVRTWTGLTWDALKQNPEQVAQWEKLGYTVESAGEIITQPFDYEIDYLGLILTFVVIVGYYLVVFRLSEKEYRQVIAEKFE
jgi:hypothetical protein